MCCSRIPGRGPAATILAAAALLLPLPSAADALRLGAAFAAALNHDPAYRAAAHALEAARQNEPIARASLLPAVTLSASTADVEGTRRFPNALGQDVQTRLEYASPQASLTIRMPLLNYDGMAGVSQAQAQTAAAQEQFRADALDLVERLAGAYLQLAAAQETRRQLVVQVDALQVKLGQTQRRTTQGEGTQVQLAQARAALEVGRGRLVEADRQLAVARDAITRLTGLYDASVPALPQALLPVPLQPDDLDGWIALALQWSPRLRQSERAVDVARAAVRRQYAGHLPRLDAVGSLSRAESDSTANIGQTTSLRSFGVQFTMPLYSGGGVDASVRQALSRQMQAEEELRREREELLLDVNRYWQAMRGAEARVRGLDETLRSSVVTLRGAQRSLEEGLGTTAEVADVRSALVEVERQLLQARLDHLQARARLQLRAGLAPLEIVTDIDRAWLTGVSAAQEEAKR
ncbi:MAG: TolC family protein [Burkholderiales bacterium]|nr:TolC family protein [Burkholderiales bacterium]